MKKDLGNFISRPKKEDPEIEIKVDIPRSIPAISISPDSPLIRILSDTIMEVTSRKPECFGVGGITVAKNFILEGTPAPVFSLGDVGLCHMANEFVTIKDLVDNAKIFALLSYRIAEIE